MTESTEEQQSRFMFLQVSDDLMPADEQEREARSDFFCKAVFAHFKQNFTFAVDRCRSGELGEQARQGVEANADEFSLLEALKEVSATSIQMVTIEQGDDVPEWLSIYLRDALSKTDLHVYPTPTAQALMEKRREMTPVEMLTDLSATVCSLLGLDVQSGSGQMFFAQISSAREFCNELLLFSLTQPDENLKAHLALYGR
ncbi:MAG: hypothetical protein K2W95_28975 [Candidatus Obscuribacterales bacterium]|nr:hypothetical protein [Candidatus Obscuribacterales bacterium]